MDDALRLRMLEMTVESVPESACTGCAACCAACPVRAIDMAEGSQGFSYPRIDYQRCVKCGRCRAVCGALHQTSANAFGAVYYAATLADESELSHVSSGGAFWAIAQSVIARGGVVYGAARASDLSVAHIRAEDVDALLLMRGSKYQQSFIAPAYLQAKQDLENGRLVLFSGVPCQIEGFRLLLGRDYPNLLTCAVVCHGMPSSRAFRMYCAETEKAARSKITRIECRDKSLGWKHNSYAVYFENQDVKRCKSAEHPFHKCYLAGLMSRLSCGCCRHSTLNRNSDISLADYWKYEGRLLELSRGMGVSLVICSTDKGRDAFLMAGDWLDFEETAEEKAVASCRHLTKTPFANPNREAFLQALEKGSFFDVSERFTKRPGLSTRFFRKLERALSKQGKRGE